MSKNRPTPTLKQMQESASILKEVFKEINKAVAPGVTGKDIDFLAYSIIVKNGGIPAFLGFDKFPATCCISVNQQVVHGAPTDYKFKDGDKVSVDCGVSYNNAFSDACRTYAIGKCSERLHKLLVVTQEALDAGIQQAVAGNRIGNISYSIQRRTELSGYNVSREFVGHGIGFALHLSPWVPNFGIKTRGRIIRKGMFLAIEPVIFDGSWKTLDRGPWNIVTMNGNLSAHFEDTVYVSSDGPVILTR